MESVSLTSSDGHCGVGFPVAFALRTADRSIAFFCDLDRTTVAARVVDTVVDVAKRCVKAASGGMSATLSGLDVELDDATKSIWDATSAEVSILREALGEIREALAQTKNESDDDEEDD
jgi:hypothetical protein